MLPVRHEAEEMESFRMLRGEIERMAVCRFGLGEAAGPLMDSSFFKPRLNRRRGAVMPHRFLTPSLSPIHDASQRVAEKRPTGQRQGSPVHGVDRTRQENGAAMRIVNLSDYQIFNSDKMKKNNIFQTARFFCDVYCFEPGQEQKGHVHGEQDKVYLVLEGQGTFRVGSEEHVLGPGQGTMASAGEEHGVKNESGQRLKVLIFVAPNP
jgi:mannose-6-phosphate isomerase-like protein (cupin superfamily)